MNPTVNWDVIVPVITFFIGFSYGLLDKYLVRKREIDNIKKFLFTEIKEIFKIYMLISEHLVDMGDFVGAYRYYLPFLSFDVYKTYLEKISTINPIELEKMYSLYRRKEYMFGLNQMILRIDRDRQEGYAQKAPVGIIET